MMWGYYGPWNGGGFGVMGMLFMVVWWIVIIGVIAGTARWFVRHREEGLSAMEILKERYAKGEITKKEFEEMKKELSE